MKKAYKIKKEFSKMDIRRLIKFLIITFTITWGSFWLLALLISKNIVTVHDPAGTILFLLGAFGVTIASVFVLPERVSVKSVIRFVFSHRKNTIGYLLLFSLLLVAVLGLSSMEVDKSLLTYQLPFLLIMVILMGGGHEELGWRGVLQPLLEKKFPFPIATVITSAIWVLWHIPLWFVKGSDQYGTSLIEFCVYVLVMSFILAAIYKKTRCVFYCSIFHGLSNVLTSLFVTKANGKLLIGLLMISIVSVVVFNKKLPNVKFKGSNNELN